MNQLRAVQKTIIQVAELLNSTNTEWLLGGSAALMVLGIDIIPHDLDILVTPENIDRVTKQLNFLRNSSNGIEIEIIKLDNLDSPKTTLFQNIPIPVNTLEEELFYYKQRLGKKHIVKLIEEKLSTKS